MPTQHRRKPPPLLTQQQIADMMEVGANTVSRWLQNLEPNAVEGRSAKYTLKRVLAHLDGGGLNPQAEAARLAAARADAQEMANAQSRGELLDAATAVAQWERVLGEIKAALLAMPRKAAPMLASMDSLPEIERHLDDEIRDALIRAASSGEGAARSDAAAPADGQPVGRRAPPAQP